MRAHSAQLSRLFRTTVLAVILSVPTAAAAKCGQRFFEFAGGVVDKHGNAAVGVLVGVSWADEDGPAGPALGRTDAKGRYAIPLSFHPGNGRSFFRGDVCDAKLKQVSVTAYTDSDRSQPLRVAVGSDWAVDVPVITVDRAIQHVPLFPEDIGASSADRGGGTNWDVGSEWKFVIRQGLTGTPQTVVLRVAEGKADSCLSGDWKRLELVSGSYEGMSEPAYMTSGGRMEVLLRSDICDSYDHLEGTVGNGLYVARHSVFGLGSGKNLGSAYAIRTK